MVDKHGGGLHEDGDQSDTGGCAAGALVARVVAEEDDQGRDVDEILGDEHGGAHEDFEKGIFKAAGLV